MDPLAPYKWAKGELGVAEIPGYKNNDRIIWYHSFTTLKATSDEVAWCSSFMCAAAIMGEFPSTRSAAAVSWADYGAIGFGDVGDIAVFKRVGGHHVAFINLPSHKGNEFINCLGGNQSDKVCVKNYNASDLIAIRRFIV